MASKKRHYTQRRAKQRREETAVLLVMGVAVLAIVATPLVCLILEGV